MVQSVVADCDAEDFFSTGVKPPFYLTFIRRNKPPGLSSSSVMVLIAE